MTQSEQKCAGRGLANVKEGGNMRGRSCWGGQQNCGAWWKTRKTWQSTGQTGARKRELQKGNRALKQGTRKTQRLGPTIMEGGGSARKSKTPEIAGNRRDVKRKNGLEKRNEGIQLQQKYSREGSSFRWTETQIDKTHTSRTISIPALYT